MIDASVNPLKSEFKQMKETQAESTERIKNLELNVTEIKDDIKNIKTEIITTKEELKEVIISSNKKESEQLVLTIAKQLETFFANHKKD